MRCRYAICLLFFAMLLQIGMTSQAHDGHDQGTDDPNMRVWNLVGSRSHIHGVYIASRDGKVLLRRPGGTVVSIEIERLTSMDQKWIAHKVAKVKAVNENAHATDSFTRFVRVQVPSKPDIADTFEPFAKLKAIHYRRDDKFFYVESNSMPEHRMMVGITAWQQQVPIPQPYFGDNAWRIPLEPIVAKRPISTRTHFFRGAIALAANGVPIFNPIKNDGRTDTLLAGELDEFGGHCGRGDDYHYHIAPTHLQEIVGQGRPIAYALDGYPIYGFTEPDGSEVKGLDEFNGHATAELGYHYHATKHYPYLNGGFHGEVNEIDGQVSPQPRAGGVREALTPLRGARITNFESKDQKSFSVEVQVGRETRYVNYVLNDDGSVTFDFIDGKGNVKTQTYSPRQQGPRGSGGKGRGGAENDRTERRENLPGKSTPVSEDSPSEDASKRTAEGLVITSSAIGSNGRISTEFTCDGEGVSPPLEWKGAPAGTKAFAISLWHKAPDQLKSYWMVYNIPASVDHLESNEVSHGVVGLNDKRKASYDPMCSKGPGVKTYHVTIYALSTEIDLPRGSNDRAGLLRAIKDITLAETTLDFTYERTSSDKR